VKPLPLLATLSLAALTGCVADNQRLSIGHSVHLEALEPEVAEPIPDSVPPLSQEAGALEQRTWASHDVMVPNHYVSHHPVMWRREIVSPTRTARERGEFPSPMTSLELAAATYGAQGMDTLISTPMGVVGDTIQLPFRAVRPGIAGKKASPRWGYERSPSGLYEWRAEVPFQNAETRVLAANAKPGLKFTPPNPRSEAPATPGSEALPPAPVGEPLPPTQANPVPSEVPAPAPAPPAPATPTETPR
jgi:hypothetical protein